MLIPEEEVRPADASAGDRNGLSTPAVLARLKSSRLTQTAERLPAFFAVFFSSARISCSTVPLHRRDTTPRGAGHDVHPPDGRRDRNCPDRGFRPRDEGGTG